MRAQDLHALGFHSLVSVTPPGCVLSETSTLSPDSRGKAPGLRSGDVWFGYNWRDPTTQPNPEELDAWGANIGVAAGAFPAFDIDVEDWDLTRQISEVLVENLGKGAVRLGREPHLMLVYRAGEEPLARRRLRFWLDGTEHLVEALGEGQQWVAAGIHPSGKRFGLRFPKGVEHASQLPPLEPADVDNALDRLSELLELIGAEVDRTQAHITDRSLIGQEGLRAPSLGKLQEVVDAIPNTSEEFPGRDDYLRMGFACKAAWPDDEYAAAEVWWSWCDRWEDGVNEPGEALADWQRMKPPYEIGYPLLLDLARGLGGYQTASEDFQPLEEGEDTDDQDSAPSRGQAVAFSDTHMVERLVRIYGDEILYCGARGGWMVWDGSHWSVDELQVVKGIYLANILSSASGEALSRIPQASKAEGIATKLASGTTHERVLKLAEAHPQLAVSQNVFDADPWVLNTPEGVLDLQSGKRREPQREDYPLHLTEVGAGSSKPERWLQFLDETTGGDHDLKRYLHKLVGYLLTGSTREHSLFFVYGPGGNGKSVFTGVLQHILGSYAKVAPMETFLSSKYAGHPTDLASLAGARLVTAQETQEGRSWDEQRVKALTSGDPVAARFMRQDFFTYVPSFKLLVSGNHRPAINNLDPAWQRRMHLIPFTEVPAVVDPDLLDYLREEEAPGILGWAVQGTQLYLEEGLERSRAVAEETRIYLEEEDPFGQWAEERLEKDPDAFSETSELYQDWKEWCYSGGYQPGTKKTFSLQIRDRLSFRGGRHPSTRRRGYRGVTLRDRPDTSGSLRVIG